MTVLIPNSPPSPLAPTHSPDPFQQVNGFNRVVKPRRQLVVGNDSAVNNKQQSAQYQSFISVWSSNRKCENHLFILNECFVWPEVVVPNPLPIHTPDVYLLVETTSTFPSVLTIIICGDIRRIPEIPMEVFHQLPKA